MKRESKKIFTAVLIIVTLFSCIPIAGFAATENNVIRLAGKDRYATARSCADQYQNILGDTLFDNIIVACGTNFPDALSAGSLSRIKNAPIILYNPKDPALTLKYIQDNLIEGGCVYLLGGPVVIAADFEAALRDEYGVAVCRLNGDDRYGTNQAILEACGLDVSTLLIGTGKNYPDSLAASSTGLPILLVSGDELTEAQAQYLDMVGGTVTTLIPLGGDAVVSDQIMAQIQSHCPSAGIHRLAGENRYETSVDISRYFFPEAKTVVLTVGTNFPDALAGGPVGRVLNAPVLLVNPKDLKLIRQVCRKARVTTTVILGGEGLIPDDVLNGGLPLLEGDIGVDVSEWQPENIDWQTAMDAGICFAFLRAGYGSVKNNYKDAHFETYYQSATAAGLPVGAYWYSYANSVALAEAEADYCIQTLNNRHLDLPVVYDVEEPTILPTLSKQQITDQIVAFCEKIKAAGYTPMLYSYRSFFDTYVDYEKIKDYELWIACWDNEISADYRPLSGSTSGFEHPHQFWQYFSKSPVKGIDESNPVDLDQVVMDYDGAKSPK